MGRPLVNIGVGCKVLLRRILKEYDMVVWSGFICFGIGTSWWLM
jgi:hypothetical protein